MSSLKAAVYIHMCLHVCSHTVKVATGPTGIGLNLDKSHPRINGQLVAQAAGSKGLAVVHATWLCSFGCGN